MSRDICSLDDAIAVAAESVGSLWARSHALSLVVRYAEIDARAARRRGDLKRAAELDAIAADADHAQTVELREARGAA